MGINAKRILMLLNIGMAFFSQYGYSAMVKNSIKPLNIAETHKETAKNVSSVAEKESAPAVKNFYDEAYLKNIANEALKSYDLTEEKEAIKPVMAEGIFLNLKRLFLAYESNFKMLERPFLLKRIWNISNMPIDNSTESVIAFKTVSELDLVRGATRAQDNLISRLSSNSNEYFL